MDWWDDLVNAVLDGAMELWTTWRERRQARKNLENLNDRPE